jgi:alanine dehydrogenase
VLGGGVAGANATSVSVGLGADVTVLDTNLQRLAELDARYAGRDADTPPDEWSAYQERRARLKAELAAALAAR